jgi:hypothetical protein
VLADARRDQVVQRPLAGHECSVVALPVETNGHQTVLASPFWMTKKARRVLWYRGYRGKNRRRPLEPHGTLHGEPGQAGQARAGLTPISCHAVLERPACVPFIKERRMECVTHKPQQEIGANGAPFVDGEAIQKVTTSKGCDLLIFLVVCGRKAPKSICQQASPRFPRLLSGQALRLRAIRPFVMR